MITYIMWLIVVAFLSTALGIASGYALAMTLDLIGRFVPFFRFTNKTPLWYINTTLFVGLTAIYGVMLLTPIVSLYVAMT